ncbi:MAG TPA: FAD-binding oxidoreductase [Lapillicoccus sp.]|nr:FAD-binding oxidoreductase [Lapillicoccus sp.]
MTLTEIPTTPDRTRALADLRATVSGHLTTPTDADWDQARMPWSVTVDQRPLAVLEVSEAADVQTAVRWAVEHGVQVTAQPVGHGAASTLENVLLLRTRGLDTIAVDAPGRRVTVGAGVKAGELLAALEGTGLTYLPGSNPDPSVVGMTITGGMSWFGRAYGLGANSILGATLVDPFGRVLEVSATQHPDLFWAIRGGGGDFGIILSLDLALHPGGDVYGGRILWPVAQMPAVLRAFRTVTETAPETLTVWYHTYQFPPDPAMPELLRGQAFAAVAVAYLGDPAAGEELLAPFRAVEGAVLDGVGVVPMSRLATIADEPTEPMPFLDHSMLLDDLTDETVDALVGLIGADAQSPLTLLQIRHLGGAFARSSESDGAAGHLEQPYLLFAMGVPAAPGLAEAIAGTFAALDGALAEHTDGRTVPNFLGTGGDLDRVWDAETRSRLAAVKRRVDPLSTIRSNRPVLRAEELRLRR